MTDPINEILEFAGDAAPGNVFDPLAYLAAPARLTGHVPGLADQRLENAALRQLSRFCGGVAQFIAENYAPGVVDDGDRAKIVAGLEAAINALIAAQAVTVEAATILAAGIARLATEAEALAGENAETIITPATLAAVIADALGSLTGVAYLNVVQGWTRQQYPVQVARTGQSGAQAVDCDLHQALSITATGAITISAPTNMAAEKWVTLRFTSTSAQAISWDAAWRRSGTTPLPTSTIAGKVLTASFVCLGSYMLLMGLVWEA